jgi:predicted ATPase
LLDRYFEQAKTIVNRHGGTIQKFIGDAVMAVWGVPIAREDEAEGAVRAGLGLLDAVASLGDDVGASGLLARAGVLTGQVASLADPEEGLVVGDSVNTASRIQQAAGPGRLLVDEVTRQVTSAGIAYEDAGEHHVKGKAQPLHLHRAMRVIAGRAGSRRSTGLEAPMLGRDAELRLLKDLFHASADRRIARLVGIRGPAGTGKTRLAAELANYLDGLAGDVLWHSGRCLSYGEGVAYWALAEMVRQRLGVAEEATPEESGARLAGELDALIDDPDEREEIAAALAVLIGSGEASLDRQELFAAWRRFFERLSERDPVVLIFEDMQWADEGLFDFVDELIEFAAKRPIFVCTLAREDLAADRPDWPGAVPAATCIQLDPLPRELIAELLHDLVPDLPAIAVERIVGQSEGIPLYAVEMVRTLADRGMLRQDADGFLPLGDLGELEVPATLNSLLEGRLDSLDPEEREVVKAMAVFGNSFPRASVVALAGVDESRLDEVLVSLVQKGVLTIRSDPLSPERGQFAFSQGILRTVAYEMISKRERRPRHLAAADHLSSSFPNDGDEVAEMIATHLLEAYRVAPDDQLRTRTLTALRSASRRAAAVGAPDAAERALRTAIGLADESERAELIGSAAEMAELAGRHEMALALFEEARDALIAAARPEEAERLEGPISLALGRLGRQEESIARMRVVTDSLDDDRIDAAGAVLLCELGRSLLFAGHSDEAGEVIERALTAAEALEMPELICRLLNLKGGRAIDLCRYEEARALYNGAIEIGEQFRLPVRASVHGNAADLSVKRDMPDAIEQCEAALATGRQLGNRAVETISLGNLMMARLLAGDWDEVERIGNEALESLDPGRSAAADIHFHLGLLAVRRGRDDEASEYLARIAAWESGDDVEARQLYVGLDGLIALGEGDHPRALELLTDSVQQGMRAQGPSSEGTRLAWFDAVVAALELERRGDATALVDLLEDQPTGLVPPLLRSALEHARGLIGLRVGESPEPHFRAAVAGLEKLGYPFWLARAQTDLGTWLADQGRRDEARPLLDEAEGLRRDLGMASPLAPASAPRAPAG